MGRRGLRNSLTPSLMNSLLTLKLEWNYLNELELEWNYLNELELGKGNTSPVFG